MKKLGNGALLTALDLAGNDLVDRLAKEAARADRLPRARCEEVRRLGEVLTAVATWIGQATELANQFPDPHWAGVGKRQCFRDSEGVSRRPAEISSQRRKRQQQVQQKAASGQSARASAVGSMAGHEKWEGIKQRVRDKERDQLLSPQPWSSSQSSLVRLRVVQGLGDGSASETRSCRKRKWQSLRQPSPDRRQRLRGWLPWSIPGLPRRAFRST